MYQYKFKEILFNDEKTKLEPGNITVIIGPNNSGKSRALKDIVSKITEKKELKGVIVMDVDWVSPQNFQELREAYKLDKYTYRDQNGHLMFRKLSPKLHQPQQTNANDWTRYENNPQLLSNKLQFAGSFGFAMLAFLTTEYRLQLVKEVRRPDIENQESNLLHTFYNGGSNLEKEIQYLVNSAFGKKIILDYHGLKNSLLIRIADNFEKIPPDSRDAQFFLQEKDKLDEQGDGIRSFVGIVTALMAIKRDVFLIDEPEVFLHPPQAFKMGEFIAKQSNGKRQIILATHSADLLRGILNKTKDVKIIRIDRKDDTNSFHELNPDKLEKLVNNPLLMSARVLDGLFYSGVVVVEGDSDARFYQAVSNKRRNDMDLHFVNADNKQTVPTIITMYRSMGVRCAGIVDFDVLNDKQEFKKQLESLDFSQKQKIDDLLSIREEIAKVAQELPPNERIKNAEEKLSELLDSIKNMNVEAQKFPSNEKSKETKEKLLKKIQNKASEIAASTKNWKDFKEKGREALSTEELKSKFNDLSEACSKEGLFINPLGELESMLVHRGISYTTDKREWLTNAMKSVSGLEVNDDEYPWKFIKEIQDYLNLIHPS